MNALSCTLLSLAVAQILPACAPAPEDVFDGHRRCSRICSVTLATDEILAELVPVERMAAVTYMVDDKEISNVTGHYPRSVARIDANLELILAVRPDLVVVAPYTQASFLEQLRHADVPVFRYTENDSFASVRAGILALGRAVGEPDRALWMVERMGRRLALLKERVRAVSERPRVLYWARGWTSGAGTNVGDMIERAGAINLAAEMGLRGHPQASLEAMLTSGPDVVLIPSWSLKMGGASGALPTAFHALAAVRAGHVLTIEGRYIGSASQFIVDGAERLAERLHPELIKEGG